MWRADERTSRRADARALCMACPRFRGRRRAPACPPHKASVGCACGHCGGLGWLMGLQLQRGCSEVAAKGAWSVRSVRDVWVWIDISILSYAMFVCVLWVAAAERRELPSHESPAR